MKTNGSISGTKKGHGRSKAFASLLAMTLIGTGASAASFSSGPGILSTGTGYVIVAMILFIGYSINTILKAKNVLEQNGKSVEFSFSSFKWSSKHSKTAGIVFFSIVILGIIWALNY